MEFYLFLSKPKLCWSHDCSSHTTGSCSVAQKPVKEWKLFPLHGNIVCLLTPSVASAEQLWKQISRRRVRRAAESTPAMPNKRSTSSRDQQQPECANRAPRMCLRNHLEAAQTTASLRLNKDEAAAEELRCGPTAAVPRDSSALLSRLFRAPVSGSANAPGRNTSCQMAAPALPLIHQFAAFRFRFAPESPRQQDPSLLRGCNTLGQHVALVFMEYFPPACRSQLWWAAASPQFATNSTFLHTICNPAKQPWPHLISLARGRSL